MPAQDLQDWLDEQQERAIETLLSGRDAGVGDHGALWYVKRLSANDTQAGGSHQAGPYIRKQLLFRVMPSLYRPNDPNPRVNIEMLIDSHSDRRTATVIWYNNILRGGKVNETRITGLGGDPKSPLLNPDLTGAVAVFAFHPETATERPRCHVSTAFGK